MSGFKPNGVLAYITDFGRQDDFVGQMHGAAYSVHAGLRIVDLLHDVPPGDEKTAAFMLHHDRWTFAAGTVFAAVVDPGVGTDRAILVAHVGDHLFLAPDNGLLGPILEQGPVHELRIVENTSLMRDVRSNTFHGRDIFSPVAAHLAAGTPLADVGPEADGWVRGPSIHPEPVGGEMHGSVMWVDRFGNLITNLDETSIAGRDVYLSRRALRRVGTFSEGRFGEPVWVLGSKRTVEVVVNGGNASKVLGIGMGHPVLARSV